MKIRTKLNVGAALSVVIFLAIGVSLYSISKLVNQSVERGASAVQLLEHLTELRWVAFDYVLYGKDLAHTQWELKYRSFETYLISGRSQWNGESLLLVDRIIKEHRELKMIVEQFNRPVLSPEYRKRLSGQLAVKTQSMITEASTLDEVSRKEISETRRVSFLLIMILVSLVTGIMGLNSWLLYRGIVSSLAKVQHGTELVATGNLHQLIGMRGSDEISGLAEAFDEMTVKLRRSYASLEEEVAERKYAEESLRRERDLVSRILETSPVGIMRVNRDGEIVFANVRAQEVLGITRTEEALHLYTAPAWPMANFDGRPYQNRSFPFAQVIAAGKTVRDIRCVIEHPGGRKVYLSINGSPLFDEADSIDGGIFVVEDITAMEEAQAKILRLNRVYSVLSNTNQAIVRLRDRKELFEEACRIAVTDGRFAMAWIGVVNDTVSSVDVIAHYGTVDGYFEDFPVPLDGTEGQEGLTCGAIRDGKYVVSNDIACDDRMAPWREQHRAWGFRSTAAFPLILFGKTVGAFTLYSAEVGYFDDEEIKLLSELATDIAFGVEAMVHGEQLRRAEEAMRETSQVLQELVVASPLAIIAFDVSWKVTMWNPAAERLFGWTAQEVIGRDAPHMSPAIFPDVVDLRRRVEAGELLDAFEVLRQRKDGTPIYIRLSTSAMRNGEGKFTGVMGMASDITSARQSEEAFRQLEERFSKAFHANPIPIGIERLSDGRFIDVNERFLVWTGYSRHEILGHTGPELNLWPEPAQRDRLLETLAERKSVRGMEIKLRTKTGEVQDILAYYEIVELSNEPCMLGMLYDITERKRTEQQVLSSLTEKEMLLKEIHHRVKNNLQVISSLLNLQTDYVKDEHDLALFRESQNRVKSMALIHEKLYHSNTLSRIDFDMYMRDLTAQLFRTYNVRDVSLDIEVEPSSFGVDTAIPCGLIINELVSNALKYAFPDGRTGRVRVSLQHTGEDLYILSVSDDGVGFPPGLDYRNTKSLGLQLVMTLTTQLGAEIALTREQGTTFTITFALKATSSSPSGKADFWPKPL